MVQMTPLQSAMAEKLKPSNLAPRLVQRSMEAMRDVGASEGEIAGMFLSGAMAVARKADDRQLLADHFIAAAEIVRKGELESEHDGD